jgi:hypothetical protein
VEQQQQQQGSSGAEAICGNPSDAAVSPDMFTTERRPCNPGGLQLPNHAANHLPPFCLLFIHERTNGKRAATSFSASFRQVHQVSVEEMTKGI